MLRFKQFINEWLNDNQKLSVNKWLPDKESGRIYSPKAEEISRHIMPEGQHAIVIPAIAHTMRAVHEHLNNNGYSNHDYAKGTTTDRFGRIVSIGKALEKTKASQELKHDFANDDRKNAVDLENHDIIISRHPYHVAEGSTNKPWKSCNTLTASGRPCKYGDGAAARRLPAEIQHGTHVAYLVPKLKEGELSSNSFPDIQSRIDKTTGRIYLKPYESEDSKHTVLVPENKIYQPSRKGEKNLGFLRSVQEFASKHFPMKEGEVYNKNRYVYDDDGSVNTPKFNLSETSFNILKNHRDPRVRTKLIHSDSLSDDQINHLIDHFTNPHDLAEISERKKLSNDQIQKLLDKNIPHTLYGIAHRENLHPKFIDHIINKNDESANYSLTNNNTKSLTSDQLHKIIDTSIKNEHQIINRMKQGKFNDQGIAAALNNTTLSGRIFPKLFSNDHFDSSHLNKILNSDNPDVARTILVTNSNDLSNEHLKFLHDKWKSASHLEGYNNPAKRAEEILDKRETPEKPIPPTPHYY